MGESRTVQADSAQVWCGSDGGGVEGLDEGGDGHLAVHPRCQATFDDNTERYFGWRPAQLAAVPPTPAPSF
jgi:hypothetical protein